MWTHRKEKIADNGFSFYFGINGHNNAVKTKKEVPEMDEQTRKLLEECSSGCKMAISSLEQITGYIRDTNLKKLVESYISRHKDLEAEAVKALQDSGNDAKDPGALSSAFAWFTTEMKLTFNDDNTRISKLLMDGCNMGIKTLGERMNTLNQADGSAQSLARKIIKAEQDLMKELQAFL